MSRIYDSSAITQRRRDLAQAGSFINRIQNPNNPQTSYGPLQGNYDASIMNSIKMGQPKEFYRNEGCIIISNGCPCPPIAVNEILPGPTPPVILAPGSVTNIQVRYGSVIVTWDAPTTGGTPTSYTLFADDQTTSANSVTITGITDVSYIFPTYTGPAVDQLTAGDEYLFSVIAVNSAGSSTADDTSPFYAPFIAPSVSIVSNTTPNTIDINITQYIDFSPSNYILKQYVNNSTSSTIITNTYSQSRSGGQIIVQGLSINNVYAYQVQLYSGNNYTSITVKSDPITVYPAGPTITNVSSITSSTVQVTYENYTTTGFDLETGGAVCIISGPGSGYSYNSLTNTSVTITMLSPLTSYTMDTLSGLHISFRKTINGNIILSGSSPLTTFMTKGIPPVVLTPIGTTGDNATITFEPYSSTSGTVGQFNFNSVTFTNISPSLRIESTSTTEIQISNLSYATTYSGCTMTLIGPNGETSDPSNTFTIVTKSSAPQVASVSSTTDTTATCTLVDPYTGFIESITVVKAYDITGGQPHTERSVSYTAGSNIFIITNLVASTAYDIVITVSNGIYTSIYSSSFGFTTSAPPEPAPIMQPPPSMFTWTTANINFQNYKFNDNSDPTGAIVTSNTYGNISVNSQISTTFVVIQYLTPGTTYSDLQLALINTNNNLESRPAAVDSFSTATSIYNFNTVTFNSSDSTSATYSVSINLPSPPSTSYVIGNLGSNPTQEFSTSFTSLSNNTYNILITNLVPNSIYNNIKIALTDGTYFTNFGVDSQNQGSFSTTPTPPTVYDAPIMSLIDNPTRANVTGVYNGSSVEITFNYADYSLMPSTFTPTSGELLNSNDDILGTYVSVTNTSLVISGIFPNYYTDYKIKLFGNSAVSQATIPFNFSAIPILNAVQNPSPNPNPIRITYSDMLSNFSFAVSSGYIYVPSLSNFPYSSEPGASDTSSNFSPSGGGSLSDCYIVLINTSNIATLPSNIFTIDIGYPGPTGIGTSPGETNVTITYNPYSILSPSSGGLFDNNGGVLGIVVSASSTELSIDNLTSGTTYNDCYITLSDGSNTTRPSIAFGFTTTSPPGPEAPQLSSDHSGVGFNYATLYFTFNSFTPIASYSRIYLNGVATVPLFISSTSISVFGLSSGSTYNNTYILLSNGSSTSSNSNEINFTTNSGSAPEAPYVYSYPTGETYVTIQYNTFNPFTPSAQYCILVTNLGSFTVSSVDTTSMYVSGLSSGTSYTNCYIVLGNSYTNFSSPSNTFDFITTSPPPPTYPAPDVNALGITTGIDYVTIPYSQYTAFYPSGGTLYTNNGTFSNVISISDQFIQINGLSSGTQYDNCYITLTDNSNTSDPSYPTYSYFSFTTQNPSPSYPAPVVYAPGIFTGTDYVTIPYSQYTTFYPSGGTLYINGSSTGYVSSISDTQMTISGLSSGTQYDNCYITITDGTYTSDQSSYFSFTTYPTAPINVQLGTTAYCTQLITFDGYSATLTGATISDNVGTSYGYTNLSQSGLTITGLAPAGSYSNLTVRVQNVSGESNPSSISSFTTNLLNAPDVTNNTGEYNSGTNTATITVTFVAYPAAFTPTSGILYENTGGQQATSSNIVDNSIIFTGLTVGNYYTGCYITLTDGLCTTGSSNGFNVTTIPVIGAYQSSSPNSSPLIITYNDMGSSLSVYRGTLYIPSGGGQHNSTNATNTQIEISQSFTLGQYDGCYIILYNNSNPEVPTLRSNTFTIDIQ